VTGTRTRLLPLLGLVIALALAYAINRMLYIQERNFRFTSNFKLYLIWLLVCGLLLIVIWLALGWITLSLSHRSALVSIVFLVVGLSVFSYPFLWQSFTWIPNLMVYWIDTPLSYTGSYIVVLGFLNLFLPINRSEKS
jgi:hypothetical protein